MQPIIKLAIEMKTRSTIGVFQRRERIGIPNKSSAAIATPPSFKLLNGWLRGCSSFEVVIVCAVVLTVRVADPVDALLIETGVVTEQVGISLAADGLVVTAQLRTTEPVNPAVGVTVIVDVPLVPCVAMTIAGALSEKLGVGAAVPVVVAETWLEGELVPVELTASTR